VLFIELSLKPPVASCVHPCWQLNLKPTLKRERQREAGKERLINLGETMEQSVEMFFLPPKSQQGAKIQGCSRQKKVVN